MGTLDLDAARAARAAKAEATQEQHTVVLCGASFALPPEMPADFALLAYDGDLRGSMRALFGSEQYTAFAALGYSIDDLVELLDGVVALYGFENLGEALASRSSSSSTGMRARPTSNPTTG